MRCRFINPCNASSTFKFILNSNIPYDLYVLIFSLIHNSVVTMLYSKDQQLLKSAIILKQLQKINSIYKLDLLYERICNISLYIKFQFVSTNYSAVIVRKNKNLLKLRRPPFCNATIFWLKI